MHGNPTRKNRETMLTPVADPTAGRLRKAMSRKSDVQGIALPGGQNRQQALGTVILTDLQKNSLSFPFGFPPGRSQHNCMDAPWVGVMWREVRVVVDADIPLVPEKP